VCLLLTCIKKGCSGEVAPERMSLRGAEALVEIYRRFPPR
jgi:hypothetical protein